LDDAIAKHARGWDIDRLSRVDLCLMRLAAYEILNREDIPASVSVNEAVELAHIYSSNEAPAFINGVLGALVREVGAE
jgi:N utilization substance protein B